MELLSILFFAIGVFGVIWTIIALGACEPFMILIGLVVTICFFGGSYFTFNAYTARETKKLETAVANKAYQVIIAQVQGVYKDKLVANEKQYNLNLKYSDTKDITDLRLDDVVKISYIQSEGNNFIITVEKIK